MSSSTAAADPERLNQRAIDLAHVASLLAREASALARLHCGDSPEAHVATRAATQSEEAVALLKQLHDRGAGPDETISAAIWALTAAAVALTQAKLGTPLAPKWGISLPNLTEASPTSATFPPGPRAPIHRTAPTTPPGPARSSKSASDRST